MKWLHHFLLRFAFYRYLIDWTRYIILPGFRPLPLYTVIDFFIKEISNSSLVNRASSLAYSFMLAIFPATIFLCTLIPYIPITDFQGELLRVLKNIMPTNAYQAFSDTIIDIIKNQNSKLLSFGFLLTVYFATNGVINLMKAFNKSSLITDRRSWLKKRGVALALTVAISFALVIAIGILVAGQGLISFIKHHFASRNLFWYYCILLFRWIVSWLVIIIIFFATISVLYRYGPAHKKRWKFINPGSILATGLAVLTSIGFSYYINNFSSYNKVYGSIGTLIVVMIWMYLNSLILLIGFELNASIELSKRNIRIVKPRYNSFRSKKTDTSKN
ncbi:YihY/virulence factor BrkB family protein [Mucilaginibacter sabulilitoris]|uniref:YihY/virulence factor BrkB family protein n=1 Tax=Mucilaginibacter sabulilitoris TaxID=1173583 RepID=A0ABZ0TCJ5_9SPHI|nr:YihY/virulence factor BrkB family protein [Mucilaginibacter sabulilitoris]WPU90941.1 YihY/virulence factor BrkB family protein [Mucilaginibacter sabulilitoris]